MDEYERIDYGMDEYKRSDGASRHGRANICRGASSLIGACRILPEYHPSFQDNYLASLTIYH